MNHCRHKHRHFVVSKDGIEKAVCDPCKDALMRQGWILTVGFCIGAEHKADGVGVFGKVCRWLHVAPRSGASTT